MNHIDLVLSEELRRKLKEPFGALYKDIDSALKYAKSGYIISVGDRVSESLLDKGIEPDICIYDKRTRREGIKLPTSIEAYKAKEIKVRNPAGRLTPEAFKAIRDAVSSGEKTRIFVEGEEDLLTLAALSLAKEGSYVFYGQPDEGIVLVKADSKTKAKVREFIEEMIENEN